LKKPSVASSSSPPGLPSLPALFLDWSLGDRILADSLRARGLTVHVHSDHFPPDAHDAEWLREVGRRRWVVLTKDKMIRYRETEITALRTAKVQAVVLTSGSLRATEMAAAFLKAIPKMRRVLKKAKGALLQR